MPEILKNQQGETDYAKLFLALASAMILIIQALQSWHIAEIKAQGEVHKVLFMSKDEINKKLDYLRENTVPKDLLMSRIKEVDDRIDALEKVVYKEKK